MSGEKQRRRYAARSMAVLDSTSRSCSSCASFAGTSNSVALDACTDASIGPSVGCTATSRLNNTCSYLDVGKTQDSMDALTALYDVTVALRLRRSVSTRMESVLTRDGVTNRHGLLIRCVLIQQSAPRLGYDEP